MALNTIEYCITCKKKTMHVNHMCAEHTKKEIFLRSALNQTLMENIVFKYMNIEEFKCACCGENKISTQFVNLLDKARKMAGIPFIINSGYRCSKRNKEVEGKRNSAHLAGLAADIQAKNSHARFLIIKALLDVGIKRLIIYNTFVHADIDVTKPWEIIALD